MSDVLLVSKPIEPPWNDGSKTLARDLACAMERHTPIIFATRSSTFELPRGRVEHVLGAGANGHALPPREALRVMARVALGRRGDLVHYFFQPNPRTSAAARAIQRLRSRPTVHTVSSAPREGLDLSRVLFADRTVVLSRATERRLAAGGVRGLVRIAPAVSPLALPTSESRATARARFDLPQGAPVITFPGDLDRGEGASLAIEALEALPDVVLAMACRPKTPRARDAERTLRARADTLGVAGRVRWIGETPHVLELLGASDVVLLPSTDLGAKVDLPIVLLEAMWQGRPILVAEGSPAEELAEDGGAIVIATDRDALVAALRPLLDDEATRIAAGARARAAAIERHDPARMARRYESLYDELLA